MIRNTHRGQEGARIGSWKRLEPGRTRRLARTPDVRCAFVPAARARQLLQSAFPCPTYTDTRPTRARRRKHSYEYEDIPLIRSTYRSCGYDSRKGREGSRGGAADDDEQGGRDSDRRREGMLNPKRKRKRGEDAGACSRFLIALLPDGAELARHPTSPSDPSRVSPRPVRPALTTSHVPDCPTAASLTSVHTLAPCSLCHHLCSSCLPPRLRVRLG